VDESKSGVLEDGSVVGTAFEEWPRVETGAEGSSVFEGLEVNVETGCRGE